MVEPQVEIQTNYAMTKDSTALLAKTSPFSDRWIIDSRAANHMAGDEDKLFHETENKSSRMVVTADNMRLSIKCIRDKMIVPHRNPQKVELHNVMHV